MKNYNSTFQCFNAPSKQRERNTIIQNTVDPPSYSLSLSLALHLSPADTVITHRPLHCVLDLLHEPQSLVYQGYNVCLPLFHHRTPSHRVACKGLADRLAFFIQGLESKSVGMERKRLLWAPHKLNGCSLLQRLIATQQPSYTHQCALSLSLTCKMAQSVRWPLPVAASEPYSVT
jgi:hypothetical protein